MQKSIRKKLHYHLEFMNNVSKIRQLQRKPHNLTQNQTERKVMFHTCNCIDEQIVLILE